MKRISITGLPVWFDSDKAEVYKENTQWDGRNHISLATGSQWDHEAIYVTKGGKFILKHWSNIQGTRETYEIISSSQAAEWFAKQGFPDDQIPSIFHKGVYDLEIQ